MKRRIRRWLGLAIVPAALALLAASPAFALDCAFAPTTQYQGDLYLDGSATPGGICNLTHDVSATGSISITANAINGGTNKLTAGTTIWLSATDNDITIGDLETSGWGFIKVKTLGVSGTGSLVTGAINVPNGYIHVESLSEDVNITTGTLTANNWRGIFVKGLENVTVGNATTTTYGPIILLSHKNLKAGDIDVGKSYSALLKANQDGTSTELQIGSTAGANSIGSITAKGNANDPNGGSVISVVNGTSTSTGGIDIADLSKIVHTATADARAGWIYINAQDGTLKLSSGTLAVDGTSTKYAGVIGLIANTIQFADNVTLSASQIESLSQSNHGVSLNAETVTFGGSTTGLTINADGDGGYAFLYPKGSLVLYGNEDPDSFIPPYGAHAAPGNEQITYTGSGSAKLTVTANDGDNTLVKVTSVKTTFNGGALAFEAKGNNNNEILFETFGTYNGTTTGVFFNNTGTVTLDASAEDNGTGGNIKFYVDKLDVNSPDFITKSDGPTVGNGNGGTVVISTSGGFEIDPSTSATITADAASNGTGNAVYSDLTGSDPKAITLWAGSSTIVKLGTNNGQITLSAKGGSAGGRGGAAVVSGYSLELNTSDAVHVEATGGNGDGGGFLSWTNISALPSSLTGPVIDASGHGSGKGGKVQTFRTWNILSFDVHEHIKVDGGDSIQITDFDGSITFNNVTCRQWKNTHTWPATHWNCTGNDPEVSEDLVPDTVAYNLYNTNGLTTYETNKVVVSVFTNASDASNWFALNIVSAAGGYTIRDSGWEHIYVNPFLNGTRGKSGETITYSAVQMAEVTAHEMGHAMDIIRITGGVFQSHSAGYNTYVLRDLYDLDYVWDPTRPIPAYIPRDPCKPTEFWDTVTFSSEPPPFVNITNLHTTNAVCVSGSLNSTDFSGAWTNSQVLSSLESGFWSADTNQHWHEPYGHTFGQQNVGTQGVRPMYDEVLDQGYFVCVKAWANALLSGNATPSPTPNGWSGSCATAPAGYTPF